MRPFFVAMCATRWHISKSYFVPPQEVVIPLKGFLENEKCWQKVKLLIYAAHMLEFMYRGVILAGELHDNTIKGNKATEENSSTVWNKATRGNSSTAWNEATGKARSRSHQRYCAEGDGIMSYFHILISTYGMPQSK